MKKLLSLLLVVCMITGCLFFASCGSSKKVSVKDFEKDPQAALNKAMQNTNNAFFADDAKTQSILKDATEKGSVTVSFECDDLADVFNNVTETLYMDSKNGKFVSDTTVTMGGEELFARVFVNKDGLAVNGESIFGNNTTLLVNVATLAEKFGDSAMVEMFEIPAEALPEVEEMLATLKDSYSKIYDMVKDSEAANEIANKVYAAMNTTYATEDGSVVVTYTLNNATVKALVGVILDEVKAMVPEMEGVSVEDMEAQLDTSMEQLDEMMTLSFTEKLYIDQKSNKIVKMTVEGSATPKEEGAEAVTVALTALYTDTKNSVDLTMTADGETVGAKAEFTKTEADGKVTYKLSTDVTADGETRNMINVSYTYNKDNGEFVLALEGDMFTADGEDRASAELTGKITTTKDSATYEFNSVKAMGETITFKLSFTFKALDSIPEIPADAKDVTALTKGDWVDLVEGIQNSDLGALIMGMQ